MGGFWRFALAGDVTGMNLVALYPMRLFRFSSDTLKESWTTDEVVDLDISFQEVTPGENGTEFFFVCS
jgi:hypothetical protein